MSGADWLAKNRGAMLKMAQNWSVQIGLKGKVSWRIEEDKIAEFEEAVASAQIEYARPKTSRTVTTNAQLKTSFVNLAKIMRDIKRRYFLLPPLTEADIASLGLKVNDKIPTPVGRPEGKVDVKVCYTVDGNLQILFSSRSENVDANKSKYGIRVYYDAIAHGETMPKSGKDLRRSKFTRRKKIVIEFEPEDKGKTAFISAQFENSKGDAGQWGDMVSAIIT